MYFIYMKGQVVGWNIEVLEKDMMWIKKDIWIRVEYTRSYKENFDKEGSEDKPE